MNPSEVFVTEQLRAKGYKLTKARRAVIQALANAGKPLDINDLYQHAQALAADLGLVTVYRTLEVLDSLDLVRRVHMMNNYHGYALASPGHTHHVVCQNCHTVVEIEGCDISPFTDRVRRETGFTITGHWLEVEGLCPNCQRLLAETNHN